MPLASILAACIMAVESTAVFKDRVAQFGLDAFWDKFAEQGWTSYGIFAYSSSYARQRIRLEVLG